MSGGASELLRPGLLEGVTVAVAAPQDARAGGAGAAVAAAAAELGASVAGVALPVAQSAESDERAAEAAVAAALGRLGSLSALVVDGAGVFEQAGGREGLVACLSSVWNVARAAATQAFLPDDAGGRIVLLAPPAGRDYARPAAAGLENLARTLSIEWARRAITTVAVAPGPATSAGELAALACWLLSPAGAYFSGCLMDLRGPAA